MEFFAWQIEVSNRCNRGCRPCPRAEAGPGADGAGARAAGPRGGGAPEAPASRDMSVEDFKTIAPFLARAEHVVLEGWGESTLNPALPEIVGLARASGPRVGFVTNGTCLDPPALAALLEKGLDFIGFSLGGGTGETHGAFRGDAPGRGASDFDRLCETVRLVRDFKSRKKSDRPDVRIVFMLLRGNVHEAPLVVRLAAGLGVRRVAFIHLVHISSMGQERMRVFRYEEERGDAPRGAGGPEGARAGGAGDARADVDASLREAARLARSLGVALSLPDLTAHEVAVCEENPLRNLFVSAGGDVSPCVFLAPPLASPFRRIFRGEERFVAREVFGNVLREPFERIWERIEYRDFRERFRLRQRAMDGLYESLLRPAPPPLEPLPPPPPPCASCHKLFGL